MSKKVFWATIAIPIIAAGWVLLLAISVPAPTVSADAIDAPGSESELPAQVTVKDLKLLGCAEHICVYLIDLPYSSVDCVLAIETFIMDQSVFELECPGS